MSSASLPILSTGQPWRITPTDVTQFVRLEQCERFLRFRIAERAGQEFMQEYDVTPQRISPLLSLSGHTFEEGLEGKLAGTCPTLNYAALAGGSHNRPINNDDVVQQIKNLSPGDSIILFQTRLQAELHAWLFRGDVDLLKLRRTPDGLLDVLVVDIKSSTKAKVEHRLQVAYYRLMLEKILLEQNVPHQPMQIGVIYRPVNDPSDEELVANAPFEEAALEVFGLEDALLEIVAEPDAYIQSAHDLVLNADSTARRVGQTNFDDLPYCLTYKCDGCLNNEYCMKRSAEREDLSLLPYLTGTEKEALRRSGIQNVADLATLKDLPTGSKELVAAAGREKQVKELAATWPVGPRLDELIHRAKAFRRLVRKDGSNSLGYIPGKGTSSLPLSAPNLNPNLVRIFIDAQYDYLEERVYLLAARVVACDQGKPVAQETIVHITDGRPDSSAKEQQLFVDWTRDLVNMVVKLAVPTDASAKKSAPLHVIFFDQHEQRLMLEALARNFPPIIQATPPLYDFLTQIAAFDSPIATYLDDEIRSFRNFPMTCQSLFSVATFLKFDWNTPHPFRELFRARVFDYLGKLDLDGTPEWFTKRSRFNSSIPLEYAYAAWGELPVAEAGKHDEFQDYRRMTQELLLAFQKRRMEALEHIADSIPGNPYGEKTPFVLPDLAHFVDIAPSLAHALDEFVTIERLVELNDWKTARNAPPERRVLAGDTLLVRYCEEDQGPGIAAQNREHQKRCELKEKYDQEFRQQNPGKRLKLTKEQNAECQWSADGLRVRLRIETQGVDCDLHEALSLSSFREGDRLILYPRWTFDERLPADQRKAYTPTPKQLLYGMRAELINLVATNKNDKGRVVAAEAEIEIKNAFGGEWSRGFVFRGKERPLQDGQLYTLDHCPNNWYGYWCSKVVEGLCQGQSNTLYKRLVRAPLPVEESGKAGQVMFLAGLVAFESSGHMHNFEPGKQQFIGKHGLTPNLLVQGPPGTGKSYGTAFAVFARLQAAMKENRPFRVFVCCKTHAATDVLVENIFAVREKLKKLSSKSPGLFQQYFDERLLEVPIFRVAPKQVPAEGVTHLVKDTEKDASEAKNADVIVEPSWCIVGITPGGVYGILKAKWDKNLFGHDLCDLLVLDEASQMNLPEAMLAALPLNNKGQLIVVGDHRQMPPIVKHDWAAEGRRTFQQYEVYNSLFDSLREKEPPMIQFAESFRLHQAMAEYLRQEIYRHDGIAYHSKRIDVLDAKEIEDDLVAAVLKPEYPLIVIVHEEDQSQVRNLYEQNLIGPILRTLANNEIFALNADDGLGIVVPHRAQRAAMQQAFPELCIIDSTTGLPVRSAIDTVERFQGGERTVILVSATESDRAYLLASCEFLLDPRRLTVALSRAKQKMILVAAKSIFSLFSPDEATFVNSLIWRNLLTRTCTANLWEGEREGKHVTVWGGKLAVVK